MKEGFNPVDVVNQKLVILEPQDLEVRRENRERVKRLSRKPRDKEIYYTNPGWRSLK